MKRRPPIPAHPSITRKTLRRFGRRFGAVFVAVKCSPAELGCAPGRKSLDAYEAGRPILVILTPAETPAGLRRHLMHAHKVFRGSALPYRSRLASDRDREFIAATSGASHQRVSAALVAWERAKVRRGWAS